MSENLLKGNKIDNLKSIDDLLYASHDNGLIEIEHIADISSRLVVNRAGLKTRPEVMGGWVQRIREAVNGD